MKKINIPFVIIGIILLSTILFSACSIPISSKQKKPNNQYYYNLLANNIVYNKKYTISVLDTNFYKNKKVENKNLSILMHFMNSISKNNFIKKPNDLPSKPAYKLFFEFKNEKFVINIYNEKYISIYPWDGKYEMDYLDMSNVYAAYNLYGFCKYLIPENND
ncbi:DUF4883 family protein [Haloimpatiens sp. FM7330]|uniref:DUF4883 family protein n=1 Tax=Haloimpatiens sp. FM7330 TaxID=3298610 RepID=UPI00363EA0BB